MPESGQRRNDQDSGKPFGLGVLFVHGIGRQRRGDTLVRWGDQLTDTINRCAGDPRMAIVDRADLKPDPEGGRPVPANADMQFECGDKPWSLAEAWWAETIGVPSFGELVSWSFRVVPWVLLVHVVRRMDRLRVTLTAARGGAWFRGVSRIVLLAVGGVPLALLLSPVLIGMLALLLGLGLIPLKRVRSFVGAVQRSLAGTVGDSLILLESPIQAAAMRATVRDSLYWLEKRCDRLAIVAHSQGAALTIEALGGLSARGPASSTVSKTPAVDTLVTFGAGINKLAALALLTDSGRRTQASAKEQETEEPTTISIWVPISILLGLVSLGTYAWFQIGAGLLTVQDLYEAFIYVGIIIGGILLATLVYALTTESGERFKKGALVTVTVLALAGSLAYVISTDVDGVFIFGLAGLLGVGGAILRAYPTNLLGRMKAALHSPEGNRMWLDYYASSDPVPNGETTTADGKIKPRKIYNTASVIHDHTQYWRNVDGFVVPVARALAQASGGELLHRFPEFDRTIRKRARERVRRLRRVRWLLPIATAVFIGLTGNNVQVIGSGLTNVVNRVSRFLSGGGDKWTLGASGGTGMALLGLLVLIPILWTGYLLARTVWWAWVRHEQQLAVRNPSGSGDSASSVAFSWAFDAAVVLALALILGVLLTPDALPIWTDPFAFFIPFLSIGLPLVWVGRKLRTNVWTWLRGILSSPTKPDGVS